MTSPMDLHGDTNRMGKGLYTYSEGVCVGDSHAYPKMYAGDPRYAAQYFSKCLCGKKRKVTTVKEVDVLAGSEPQLAHSKGINKSKE